MKCPFKFLTKNTIPALSSMRERILGWPVKIGDITKTWFTEDELARKFAKLTWASLSKQNFTILWELRYIDIEFSSSGSTSVRKMSYIWFELFLYFLHSLSLIWDISYDAFMEAMDDNPDIIFLFEAFSSQDRAFSILVENSSSVDEFDGEYVYLKSFLMKLATEPQAIEQIVLEWAERQSDVSTITSRVQSAIQMMHQVEYAFVECPWLRNWLINLSLETLRPFYKDALWKRLNNRLFQWRELLASFQRRILWIHLWK